jgi:Phage major capsid protein E
MNMSTSQARVIDPILSNHARGYSQMGLIGDRLFPFVNMPTRAARRIEFGRESFKRYKIIRAPGARVARVSFGYEGKAVNLIQRALGATTPYEHVDEAKAVPGIDLLQIGLSTVMSVIALDREINQAEVGRNAAAYAASNKLALIGPGKWSAEGSKPAKDVSDAKEVIRSRTGKRPNLLVLGPLVAAALRLHPDVKEKYKHVTDAVISDAMLAAYFDVAEVIVGDAIYDDDGNAVHDVWGNDAILAFAPPAAAANMNLPSYGYTYRLGGHPFVEPTKWDDDTKSWVNDVTDEWSAEMVGPDAGFLFQNCVGGVAGA